MQAASNKFSLSGKVAIVTGGGRGIGGAIALALARAGADVIPTSRTLSEVQKVVEEIKEMGRVSLAITVDVKDQGQIQGLMDKITKKLGKIDILVNAAGISPIFKRAEETREEEWDEIIAVNVKGTFLCCQEAYKRMRDQGGGSIINIASAIGEVGFPRLAPYCVSKAGVIELTKVLALEWADSNIRVNAIAPGWVKTDMTKGVREHEGISKTLLANIPLNRFAEPDEIASAAVYLASEAASYITGAVITVDGGWLAR